MKRLVIVVVVLGVLSAAAAALAAGGRPTTEKVLGAASIRSATRDPAGFAHRLRVSHLTTTLLPDSYRQSRGRAPHEPLSVERSTIGRWDAVTGACASRGSA
jgi:hypothetical protein